MTALILLCMIADPWADNSPEVHYGEGGGYGQPFYPENILGPPDPAATPYFPSYGENNLLTPGKDGWVVVEFTDNSIIDGPGPDFTVFENVLDTGSGYFQECAYIEVSQNGLYWVPFPWNGTTLEGLAGLMPTTGADPTNPAVSGGDLFDLEDIGLNWVRFVKLTDCGDSAADGGLFDLDAVVAVNWSTGIEEEEARPDPFCVTSPFSSTFTVLTEETGTLYCYTADGRNAGQWQVDGTQTTISSSGLPQGVVFFVLNRCTASAVRLLN